MPPHRGAEARIDGMIVRLGTQRLILPLARVIETIRPEPDQVKSLSAGAEMLEVRGAYLPLRRVADLFGIDAEARPPIDESVVIVVEDGDGRSVALLVDAIEDRQELAIVPLEENLYRIHGLAGAALLADEAIALVLDITALAHGTDADGAPEGLAA